MATYPTKYSNINDFTKKERKVKEIQFPWIAPNSNLSNIDLCGQKVGKQDMGSNIKFCPICDQPMIVRMMMLPCEHIMCYSCSKPDSDLCFICEKKLTSIVRISDKAKLFECDIPDCFKFFESMEKLNYHKYYVHNEMSDQNTSRQDNLMIQGQKMPQVQNSMMYQSHPSMMMGVNPQAQITSQFP